RDEDAREQERYMADRFRENRLPGESCQGTEWRRSDKEPATEHDPRRWAHRCSMMRDSRLRVTENSQESRATTKRRDEGARERGPPQKRACLLITQITEAVAPAKAPVIAIGRGQRDHIALTQGHAIHRGVAAGSQHVLREIETIDAPAEAPERTRVSTCAAR